MKQKKRTHRTTLGISILFLLVFGMLFGPYIWKDPKGTTKAEDAAWAAYFDSLPEAKTELVYNREEQELINPGTCKSNFAVSYRFASSSSQFSNLIPKAKEAGTYKVEYKASHVDPSPFPNKPKDYTASIDNIEIKKYTPVYVAKPEPQNNLVYNGQDQVLIRKGSAALLNGSEAGIIQYRTGDTGVFDNYSNKDITAKDAGTYKVSYKIIPYAPDCKDEGNINETTPESITVSIAPAPLADNLDITSPAALSGLSYNGKEQALITQGTAAAKAGSLLAAERSPVTTQMEYSLEKNGTYSPSLPTRKDVGTYTVWYRVTCDSSNYAAVEPQSLSVTIGRPSSGGSGSSSSSSSSSSSGSTAPAAAARPEVPATEEDGEYTLLRSSDGSRTDLWVKKAPDGSTVETRRTTYPDGRITETETHISADHKTIMKSNIDYDADGKRTDTSIEITQQGEGTQTRISLDALSKLLGKISTTGLRKDIRITLTSLKEDGTENFTLTLDSSILKEKHPAIFQKTASGDLLLVTKSFTSTVNENGELLLTIPSSGNYQLLGEESAKELREAIYNSVKPEHKKTRLGKGQTIHFELDDNCNPENILSINYQSSNKKQVKVTRNGKIQMKKAGKTVTITADVTLADGKVIQAKMKIQPKKR